MDVFSRTIFAIRTDFALALSSVILGTLVGVPLGAVSGYFGGWIDAVAHAPRRGDPGLSAHPLRHGLHRSDGQLADQVVSSSPSTTCQCTPRWCGSVVVPLQEIDYVQAARVAGNGPLRRVFRHIVPNALTPVFAQLPLSCAYAIQMIAGLSFIGLGVPIPTPEWGSMIQVGASYMVFGQVVAFGLSRAGPVPVGPAAQRLVGHPAVALGRGGRERAPRHPGSRRPASGRGARWSRRWPGYRFRSDPASASQSSARAGRARRSARSR